MKTLWAWLTFFIKQDQLDPNQSLVVNPLSIPIQSKGASGIL
jgi:hypothetical protein